MNIEQIHDSFKEAMSNSVKLFPEGVNRYPIFSPFYFDDGDGLVVALKKTDDGGWIITDEGHTYAQMSYEMDLSLLDRGIRNEIIESTLRKYEIEEKGGQIFARVDNPEKAGEIFLKFMQCLIRIGDVIYLNPGSGMSAFKNHFKNELKKLIGEAVGSKGVHFDYHDKSHDPDGIYPVDCRIDGASRPVHIYAMGSEDECRDATINILQFQKWGVPCSALGIFEDEGRISRKVLSRFVEVCKCQFSGLAGNEGEIGKYLKSLVG